MTFSRTRPLPPASGGVAARTAQIPRRDTALGLAVRRAVHALGLRYFVDCPHLPGVWRRADLVIPRLRVAVFVDGCFWHSCPLHGNRPCHNGDRWRDKIERNRRGDRDTDQRLAAAGWTVVRAWEHKDPAAVPAGTSRSSPRRRV